MYDSITMFMLLTEKAISNSINLRKQNVLNLKKFAVKEPKKLIPLRIQEQQNVLNGVMVMSVQP